MKCGCLNLKEIAFKNQIKNQTLNQIPVFKNQTPRKKTIAHPKFRRKLGNEKTNHDVLVVPVVFHVLYDESVSGSNIEQKHPIPLQICHQLCLYTWGLPIIHQ